MNIVEQTLEASHSLMTVLDIKRATGLDEMTVRAELRNLAQHGQIEHIPGRGRYDGRYGLLRPVVVYTPAEQSSAAAEGGDSEGGDADVVDADLSPCEMSLLSIIADIRAAIGDKAGKIMLGELAGHIGQIYALGKANCDTAVRQLSEIDALRKALEGSRSNHLEAEADLAEIEASLSPFWPDVSPADPPEITLARHVAAELQNAKNLITKLETLLGSSRIECEAMREQLAHLTHNNDAERAGLDATLIDSYAVVAPKRAMRRFTAHDNAVKSAMAAARNGSGRGEVFALVPVGRAVRGAEWRSAKNV